MVDSVEETVITEPTEQLKGGTNLCLILERGKTQQRFATNSGKLALSSQKGKAWGDKYSNTCHGTR